MLPLGFSSLSTFSTESAKQQFKMIQKPSIVILKTKWNQMSTLS